MYTHLIREVVNTKLSWTVFNPYYSSVWRQATEVHCNSISVCIVKRLASSTHMHYIHARLLLYMYLYVFLVIVYILSVLVSTAFGNVELEVVPLCECPCSNDVVSYMYTCTHIQCIVYMVFAARCLLARGTCYCSMYMYIHV